MNKIAFDWDGTTWGSGGHQILCEMALALKKQGWDVYILTQVPSSMMEQRKKDVQAIVPELQVLVVENWSDKPIVMKENGIEWLMDDTGAVCDMVVNAGLHVLQVR